MILQKSSHKMKIRDFHKTYVYLLRMRLGSEKTFVPFVVKIINIKF